MLKQCWRFGRLPANSVEMRELFMNYAFIALLNV